VWILLQLIFVFSVLLSAVPVVGQTITTAAIAIDDSTPMVMTITGAPGDGNTALAAAIRTELARIGLPISDSARGPKYHLDAYVTVGKARDHGYQPVEVEWWLQNPEGKHQGTVMRRVELPDVSSMRGGGKILLTPPAARRKAYSGRYLNTISAVLDKISCQFVPRSFVP
jgi:hypothetical protein